MEIRPAGVEINGALVREQRKLKGHTQTALAELADISVQYLSLIEREDRKTVSPPVFARLCDALEVADRRELVRNPKAGAKVTRSVA